MKAECLVSRQAHSGTDAFHGERATAFRDATMCHASARRSSLAVPMANRVETDWAVSGARECRVPFRPKVLPAGQSVPSGTILRGSIDVNRPTAAPELVWSPKVTSLGMLGRGQGSTDECRLRRRPCGGCRFGLLSRPVELVHRPECPREAWYLPHHDCCTVQLSVEVAPRLAADGLGTVQRFIHRSACETCPQNVAEHNRKRYR